MSLADVEAEADEEQTDAESEAFGVLVGRIGRKGGAIPAEALARHVLDLVPASEWPVRVEAADALLRRLESARKDELSIDARPAGGKTLGLYATRRKGSNSRPYRTVVSGVDPIAGRCDCPDFLKNSLAACKHVLAVVEHLHSRPRLLARAAKEQAEADASPGPGGLEWDPVRPLVGFGDWLERIVWRGAGKDVPRGPFRVDGQGDARVKNAYRAAPEKRLAVVETLLSAARKAPADRPGDPAALALLHNEKSRLERIIGGAVASADVRHLFKGLSRPLYPYQREGVNRFLRATRLLLADDMGLGKTAQAIACCHVLKRGGRVRRGLIARRARQAGPDHRAGGAQAPVGARVGPVLGPPRPGRRRPPRRAAADLRRIG
jgi:hypothetical protein